MTFTGILMLSLLLASATFAGGPTPPESNTLFGLYFIEFTLTAAPPGPDYYVIGDVFLEPGATMTVEPGVTVNFAANHDTLESGDYPDKSEIIVEGGSLVVNGTMVDSVRFTSSSPTPQAGDWGQIKFSSGTGAVQFATLEYCTRGFRSLSADSVYVIRSAIRDVAERGLLIGGQKGLFQQLIIERCGWHGIESTGSDEIKWNDIRHAQGDGIYVSGLPKPIVGNDIYDCVGDGIETGSGGSIMLTNNLIVRCQGNGIYDPASAVPFIEYCTIVQNGLSGLLGDAHITNSIVVSNLRYGLDDANAPGIMIHHNNVWDNQLGDYHYSTCDSLCYSINPLFEDPDNDDFHLIMQSSLRVAGVNGTQLGRYGPNPEGSTGVPGEEANPSPIRLLQNFPNPFSASTRIALMADRPAVVRLDVLSVEGRLVWSKEDMTLREGVNKLRLSLDGMAPGVYFYRVAGGGIADMRRMVLLK